jgi:carboxyl-terminal processing protease
MHDSILAVDGQPPVVEGLRQNLLRGPEGTTIQVTAQTPGQAPRDVAITRQRINAQLPTPYFTYTSPAGKRIGYILLPTFNDSNVAIRVAEALQAMGAEAPLDGLILDVRENGGGVSTVVMDTLSYFTQGTVGYFVERDQREPLRVQRRNINGSQRLPLVVLVGSGSASFGEVFPGLLKDLGRAYLIGEQTDGNVEVLSIFNYSDGSRAWIATSTFRPVNQGSQDWEQTGIIPDWSVPTRWEEITRENDPAVQAALQYFDGQAPTPTP